jgi:hypothetical protein
MFFLPRYTLNKDFQLRGRAVFNWEQTTPDDAGPRARLGDTSVQLFYRGIPKVAGFKPLVAANVALPTSLDSRTRNMVFQPGVTAQVFRVIEVGSGEIDLLGAATYAHPFYTERNRTAGDGGPKVACAGGTLGCEGQITGLNNVANQVGWTALIAGSWGKWAPALFLLGTHQWAYDSRDVSVREATTGANGVPEVQSDQSILRTADRTTFRQALYFSAWLDYEANSWLTAEVGYFMFRPILNADATVGNPFFDRYQDTRVYLGANFNIDNMVKKFIEGEREAEAGVIRAKNTRTGPAVNFF